jgi:hypothetical protein
VRFLTSQAAKRGGGSVIAMGKIPGHPEFLSNRTAREPEESFDGWLEAGMGLASHRYGAAWTSAFELGAVQGFVWRAPRDALVRRHVSEPRLGRTALSARRGV